MNSTTVSSALANPLASFNNLHKNGDRECLQGPSHYDALSESHLQGIAQYEDLYLITQNRSGHDSGKLYVFRVSPPQQCIFTTHLDVSSSSAALGGNGQAFNHPGGVQLAGKYLFVPVQTEDYNNTRIQVYDVQALTSDNPSIALVNNSLIPDCDDRKIESIGVAFDEANGNYVIVGLQGSDLYFYRTAGSDLSVPVSGGYAFTCKVPEHNDAGPQTINLLYGGDGQLYLVNFAVREKAVVLFTDYAYLYQVTWSEGLGDPASARHFITHGSSTPGVNQPHFRWGSGIHVDETGINLLVTQRVMQEKCYINRFEQKTDGSDVDGEPEGTEAVG